jgi:hypothetical protein
MEKVKVARTSAQKPGIARMSAQLPHGASEGAAEDHDFAGGFSDLGGDVGKLAAEVEGIAEAAGEAGANPDEGLDGLGGAADCGGEGGGVDLEDCIDYHLENPG